MDIPTFALVQGKCTIFSVGGCGRIIKNDRGEFVMSFMWKDDGHDNFLLELWAILRGLKIAWDKGIYDR